MKPTYTVRLTGDLDADERQRVAARVAGVTDIEADKIERLLERGVGRDLIKPSSANVANRLASVLAEAGAPIQLVPITQPEPAPTEAEQPDRTAGADAQADVLRPRTSEGRPPVDATAPDARTSDPAVRDADASGSGAEAHAQPEEAERPRIEAVNAEGRRLADPEPAPAETSTTLPADTERADTVPADTVPADTVPADTERADAAAASTASAGAAPVDADAVDADAGPTDAEEPEAQLPEPALPEPGDRAEPEAPPPPQTTTKGMAEPGTRAREADRSKEPPPPPRTVEPPQPVRPSRGAAILGAVGAALLGIGAFFALDLLVNPIAIGILVLAVLALGLSLLGQRRAMWLPGLGALALIVWALANAEAGAMATLAAHWQWYAMFAGALLVLVAGFQEAQRGRGA